MNGLAGKIGFCDEARTPPCNGEIRAELEQLRGRRLAIALSGGVDSSVAAALLAEAGVELVGLSLRLHDPDPTNPLAPRACCPPDDLQDARRIAEQLDFPFYVIDARAEFDHQVVKPFVRSYLLGKTPNPCVGCNAFVKLERLHRRALALGCVGLATGHYARVRHTEQGPRLYEGADKQKDQSYFLFGTSKEILQDLWFPLGGMDKAEVREAALSRGLPVAHKLDSQEVCFVGGAGAGGFVMRQPEARGDHRGPILDEQGNRLGEHPGVMNYTVGQRKGLGIAAKHPLHVLSIDAGAKSVTVGPAESLYEPGLLARRANWPTGAPIEPVEATVRIRYRDRGRKASVMALPEGGAKVVFDHPARSISPGQAAVFYRGEEVLGGAWIERSLSKEELSFGA